MTNGRPYKKALSPDEVSDEFKRCSGTQFDPELVKIFLSIREDE
jgi:HD-GYP domain-containing protein (c-di-GMP phosphodiesterase class II)